jgi:hypothetical protein
MEVSQLVLALLVAYSAWATVVILYRSERPAAAEQGLPASASARSFAQEPLHPQYHPQQQAFPTGFTETRVSPTRLLFHWDRYEFAMVSDLDLASRQDSFTWMSYFKRGVLHKVNRPPQGLEGQTSAPTPAFSYRVEWKSTFELKAQTAMKNRSMELSELVRFGRLLLAFCDFTGWVMRFSCVGLCVN